MATDSRYFTPSESSVNDGIEPEMCSLKYTPVAEAVQMTRYRGQISKSLVSIVPTGLSWSPRRQTPDGHAMEEEQGECDHY